MYFFFVLTGKISLTSCLGDGCQTKQEVKGHPMDTDCSKKINKRGGGSNPSVLQPPEKKNTKDLSGVALLKRFSRQKALINNA